MSNTKNKGFFKILNTMWLYHALLHTPFKGTIAYLHSKLLMICPYEPATLQRLTADILNKTAVFSILTVMGNLMLNVLMSERLTLYAIASSTFLIWTIYSLVSRMTMNKLQRNVEHDFREYISKVIHEYGASKSVISSLNSAVFGMSADIEKLVDEMKSVIWADNARESVSEYVSDRHRPSYVRTFVAQCYECATGGDNEENGESLFRKHLERIRFEMKHSEIYTTRRDYSLRGKTMIVLLPVILFPIFGRWGVSFSPDTKDFYESYGYIIQILTLASSVFLFKIIEQTKDISIRTFRKTASIYSGIGARFRLNVFSKKSERRLSKKLLTVGETIPPQIFVLKMIAWGFAGLILTTGIFAVGIHSKRTQILTDPDISSISVPSSLKAQTTKVILDISNEYKDEILANYDDSFLIKMVEDRIVIINRYTKEQIVEEIKRRNATYHDVTLNLAQILVMLLSPLACFVPLIELNYYYKLCLQEKDNEIRLFRTLILMEKDSPRVTTYELLREMESHSVLFRHLLTSVTMEFTRDRDMALKLMQYNQPDEIREMADNFMAADRVGLKNAFNTIEADMNVTEAENALINEIRNDKAQNRLSLLVYIPFIISIGGNFILPFVLSSLKGVTELMDVLGELQNFGF